MHRFTPPHNNYRPRANTDGQAAMVRHEYLTVNSRQMKHDSRVLQSTGYHPTRIARPLSMLCRRHQVQPRTNHPTAREGNVARLSVVTHNRVTTQNSSGFAHRDLFNVQTNGTSGTPVNNSGTLHTNKTHKRMTRIHTNTRRQGPSPTPLTSQGTAESRIPKHVSDDALIPSHPAQDSAAADQGPTDRPAHLNLTTFHTDDIRHSSYLIPPPARAGSHIGADSSADNPGSTDTIEGPGPAAAAAGGSPKIIHTGYPRVDGHYPRTCEPFTNFLVANGTPATHIHGAGGEYSPVGKRVRQLAPYGGFPIGADATPKGASRRLARWSCSAQRWNNPTRTRDIPGSCSNAHG